LIRSSGQKLFLDSPEKLGIDAFVFISVIVGAFGALWLRPSSGSIVAVLAVVFIAGWVGNKLVDGYISLKKEEMELKKIRSTEGQKLLEKYEHRQGRLPFEKRQEHD